MAKYSLVAVCLVMAVSLSKATIEQDEQDCADQLQNLASCIPYVSGSAKKPTQQCCDDTVKVRSKKPKCLCVLIKESADPSMALPVNTTLALQMPSACNIDAKVSDCPAILKLPPNSPDAKLFKDTNTDSTTTSGSSSSSSTSPSSSISPSSSSSSSSDSKASPNSNEGEKMEIVGSAAFSLLVATIAWVLV